MIEIFPNIINLSNIELENSIDLLKNINCNDRQIRNILISNPYYLDRSNEDILNLIKKLIQINIKNINLLFDSNPFLLNKDAYEIEEYIYKELNKGKILDEIIDEFESNPYIIDEE